MRHDPASAALGVMLRRLKMFGMAQAAVGELIEQGAPVFEAAVPTLSQLHKAELAEREVRSIAHHIKSARFPAYKDLASFDFAAREVNEASVRQLPRGEFTDRADNVVLIGSPGTGKAHLADSDGRRRGRYEEAARLRAVGVSISAIAAALGAERKTVRRWLRAGGAPLWSKRPRPSILKPPRYVLNLAGPTNTATPACFGAKRPSRFRRSHESISTTMFAILP